MNGYVMGVVAELIVGLAKCALVWRELRSIRTKNMAKIGLKYSCLRGSYVPLDTHVPTFWEYGIWCLGICPLASWAALVVDLGMMTYLKLHYKKPPPPIRDLQEKVSRHELTREELLNIVEELRGFYEHRVA